MIWQIISFILLPNEYGCVYASLNGPANELQKMPILAKKKSCFQMKLILILAGGCVNKQNCPIWGTENPHAYIEKPMHPKRVTVWCGFLVQRHNWAIFLRKWARNGRYSQWRSLLGHIERNFLHKNWRGEYWQHLVSTGRHYVSHNRSYTRCLTPCFWISHYQQQSWCRLASSELWFDTVGLLFVG